MNPHYKTQTSRLLALQRPYVSGLVVYAMKGCSMKRKSTICAMQSLVGCAKTKTRGALSRSTLTNLETYLGDANT